MRILGRYNKEEIEEEKGRAPVRSYFCKLCGGWHVTSKMSEALKASSDKRDERLMAEVDEYAKSREKIEPYLAVADHKMAEADMMIQQGKIDEAEKLLKDWRKQLEPFRHSTGEKFLRWGKRDRKIEALLNQIGQLRKLDEMTIEDRRTILDKKEKTKEEMASCQAYRNMWILRRVNELMVEADDDIKNGRKEVADKLSESRKLLKKTDCQFKKVILKERRAVITEKEEQAVALGLMGRPAKVERKFIRRGSMEFREAVLFLIAKFEDLQRLYEEGDMDECESILETIDYGLEELQQDETTKKLKELFEGWKGKVYSETDTIV